MVPHVRDRPLNLWRWNTGIDGRLVVQQDIPKGAPDWVARVETPRRKGGSIEHVLCQDADTLRWLANQNCITPHVWSARRDRLDRPDRVVFDFDPEAGSDFALVREGALLAGERLRELGLEPFAMVTGSKGIHVVAPIKRTREAGVGARAGGRAGRRDRRALAGHADHRVAQGEARRQDPRRHGAQHLRPDRRGALRGAGAAGRAGGDAAGVGGAVGPGAVRALVDAAHGGRAARGARRSVGGHRRPRGTLPG